MSDNNKSKILDLSNKYDKSSCAYCLLNIFLIIIIFLLVVLIYNSNEYLSAQSSTDSDVIIGQAAMNAAIQTATMPINLPAIAAIKGAAIDAAVRTANLPENRDAMQAVIKSAIEAALKTSKLPENHLAMLDISKAAGDAAIEAANVMPPP